MAGKTCGVFVAIGLTLGGVAAPCPAGEALTVRAVRPDEQAGRLIGLFSGSRAPHPAAALSAWKHAGRGKNSLGKPLEAAIAALNPAMVRELKSLDGSELLIGFATGAGKVRWRAVVPEDGGRLAAIGPALALTDGAVEGPLGGAEVFRLGPPGAAVMASGAVGLAVASDRDGLGLALERLEKPRGDDERRPGWHARLDPSGLVGLSTVTGRRLAGALDAVGCREVRGWLALDGEALTLRVTSVLGDRPRVGGARLDPSWLDAVPGSGTLAAVSVALDTRPEALDAAFAAIDRVERADPARAGVAPSRTRLNLLAAAARVRPEVDLWPRLRGLSAAILVDPGGELAGVVVVLHANDGEAAGRIAGEVLPRLASAFVQGGKAGAVGEDGVRPLGAIGGKPMSAATRGSQVVIGWGDGALSAALGAIEKPESSAGPALRAGWGEVPPDRAGGFWPGRLRTIAPTGSALAGALSGAPPVVWEGSTGETSALDVVRWGELRGVVRRWLDALPLEPPPDR